MNADIDLVLVAQALAFIRSGASRAVRLSKGISQRQLAHALGVEPSTVLRWERQERVPRPAAAVAYVALLRRLMGGDDD